MMTPLVTVIHIAIPSYINRRSKNRIKQKLDSKIISKSTSSSSALLYVVPKKADASGRQYWRVVIDYKKLNEKQLITASQWFPVDRNEYKTRKKDSFQNGEQALRIFTKNALRSQKFFGNIPMFHGQHFERNS